MTALHKQAGDEAGATRDELAALSDSASTDAKVTSSNDPIEDESGVGTAERPTLRPWITATIIMGIAAILTGLYFINPAERPIGPPCALYVTTGLHCPGCGGTRAAHALLHGDFRQAAAWNVSMFVVLPVLAGYGIYFLYMLIRHRRAPAPNLSRRAVIIIAIVFIAFMVLRNLPFEPFASLAPHPLPRAAAPETPEG